jgi:hypothetical protein
LPEVGAVPTAMRVWTVNASSRWRPGLRVVLLALAIPLAWCPCAGAPGTGGPDRLAHPDRWSGATGQAAIAAGAPVDAGRSGGGGERADSHLSACFADALRAAGRAPDLRVDLALDADQGARTGVPVRLRWQFRGDAYARCGTPLYLVFSLPERVRFRGTKFLALPPGPDGPFGIRYQSRRARALVPLHPGSATWGGEIDLHILQAGELTLDWALVEVPMERPAAGDRPRVARGQWVIVPGSDASRAFHVRLGPPSVVIQDHFASDRPAETVHSRSGELVLEVYPGRYRVLERRTGNLVVEGDGVRPNFSPTSRFLGAYRDGYSKLDIVDLYSGERVATVSGGETGADYADVLGEVAWGPGDAFVAASLAGWGGVAVCQTLVDGWTYTAAGPEGGFASHPEGGWYATRVRVDLDGARLLAGSRADPALTARVSLLGTPNADNRGQPADRRGSAEPWAPAGVAPPEPAEDRPQWDLAGPLALSHVGDSEPPDPASGEQSPPYVAHPRAPVAADPAGPVAVRGRAVPGSGRGLVRAPLSPGGAEGEARDGLVVASLARRLEDFGVHLALPSPVRERVPPPEPRWEAYGEDREAYDAAQQVHSAALTDWQAEVIRALVDSVPGAAAQVTPPEEMGAECPFPGPLGVHAWTLTGAWQWQVRGGPVWLLRSHCMRGSGLVGSGQLALFAPGPRGTRVHWLLSQGTADEPASSRGVLSSFAEPLGLTEATSKAALSHDRLLIHVGANETILVFDLETRRVKALFKAVPHGDLIAAVRLTSDARHLVQLNADGRFYVYALAEQKRVLSGYYLDDEVVLFTDQGYYWATAEGAQFVYLRFPGTPGLHSFQQFQTALERPDLVRAVLAGGAQDPPAPALRVPPTAELVADLAGASGPAPGEPAHREVPIAVKATAEGRLAGLRVFGDGAPAQELAFEGASGTVQARLRVPVETRWVTVVAVDERGFQSTPQSIPLPPLDGHRPAGRLFATAIGTDRYAQLPELRFARSDAQAFAASLEAVRGGYYREVRTQLFLDEPQLGPALRARIGALQGETSRDDTVMLFAAGHGLRDSRGRFYLAGRDTDPARLEETAVSWDDLAGLLAGLSARVIVFLDACHAGAAADAAATNDDAAASFVRGDRAVTVISASKGRQVSQERAEAGGGVFSMSLARLVADPGRTADANGNRVLELSEVYGELKRRVAGMTSGEQTPWIARSRMVGEMPLF